MTEPYRPAIIEKNKREEKHGSVCFRNDGAVAGAFSRHKGEWSPMESEYGKDFLLYMVEEIGEVIAILKKKGSTAIAEDPAVREAFLGEMADVLMYYNDVLLRYHVTPEEISEAYRKKHNLNMARDYEQEYKELYNG